MRNIQASGNHYGETITLQQITRPTARKLFGKGVKVFLQSSNMRPFNMWQSVCEIVGDEEQRKQDEHSYNLYKTPATHPPTFEGQFDRVCNAFEYYNCDNERGKYIHFYKQI